MLVSVKIPRCSFQGTMIVSRSGVPSPSSTLLLRSFSTSATADSVASSPFNIELQHVPSLPLVGSLPFQYERRLDNSYEWQREMRRRYRDFYSIGMPGMGVGLHGKLHVLTDPKEMVQVIRKEGVYPFGLLQCNWPLICFYRDTKSPMVNDEDGGFFGRGHTWKQMRNFLQSDLLSPSAAKGYIPGMIGAAESASQGAPEHAQEMSTYLALCSFDLFSSVMFGELSRVANPGEKTKTEDVDFCYSTINAAGSLFPLLLSPKEQILKRVFGVNGSKYDFFHKNMAGSRNYAREKVSAFRKKKEAGKLDAFEEASYCAHALEREDNGESGVDEEEMMEMLTVALIAAVDTTSGILSWALVHLALNPESQEMAYHELSTKVKRHGGKLSSDILGTTETSYLSAFLRECHRITPSIPMNTLKALEGSEVQVHGMVLPKGSMLWLDSYSVGVDPKVVADPMSFMPERWFPDAVKAREGTPAEMIDHPFYKYPFSQGARKCPGSRVANNEVRTMIAQLILDWKISFADDNIKSLDQVADEAGSVVQPLMPEFRFERRN